MNARTMLRRLHVANGIACMLCLLAAFVLMLPASLLDYPPLTNITGCLVICGMIFAAIHFIVGTAEQLSKERRALRPPAPETYELPPVDAPPPPSRIPKIRDIIALITLLIYSCIVLIGLILSLIHSLTGLNLLGQYALPSVILLIALGILMRLKFGKLPL